MTTMYRSEPEVYAGTPRFAARNQLAHSTWTRWTGLVSVVGSIGFLVLFTVLGFLRPEYSPVRQAISDLGVGNLDWALNGGVIVTGAILVAFALAFTQDAMRPVVNPGLRWLLGVSLEAQGLGLVIAGVFPETQPTHYLLSAPLFFVGSVIGLFAAGCLLWRVQGWRGFSIYSLLAGVLAGAAGYLGNDSGVSHLAAAVGTPSLVLFTEAALPWRPWSATAHCLMVTTTELVGAEWLAVRAALSAML